MVLLMLKDFLFLQAGRCGGASNPHFQPWPELSAIRNWRFVALQFLELAIESKGRCWTHPPVIGLPAPRGRHRRI